MKHEKTDGLYLLLLILGTGVFLGIIYGTRLLFYGFKPQPTIISPVAKPTPEVLVVAETDSILVIINSARAERSLEPLVQTQELTQAAQKRAEDIYKARQWSHEGFTEALSLAGLKGSFGENIARGYGSDTKIVKDWIKSPTHAENLFADCKYAGIGRSGSGVKGALGYDSYFVLWVGGCK